MKSNLKLWLILWSIFMGAGTGITQIHDIKYIMENKTSPPANPLVSAPTSSSAHLQLFLFLLYAPLITLPITVRMTHCAAKEKNKPIQILGILVSFIHVIAIITTLIRWIA